MVFLEYVVHGSKVDTDSKKLAYRGMKNETIRRFDLSTTNLVTIETAGEQDM